MTDKVEQYIQKYTRNCSNEITEFEEEPFTNEIYHPWLTPDHTRAVVKIAVEEAFSDESKAYKMGKRYGFEHGYRKAREEVIEKAYKWLYDKYNKQGYLDLDDVDELKQTMEESV